VDPLLRLLLSRGSKNRRKYLHTEEFPGSEPDHYIYIDRGPGKGCVTIWTESPGPLGGTWYGPEVSICGRKELDSFIKLLLRKAEE